MAVKMVPGRINRKGIKIDPAIPVIGFGSASGSGGARVSIMAMSRSTEADTALRSACTLQDEPAVNFSSYQLLIHPGRAAPISANQDSICHTLSSGWAPFASPHCLKKHSRHLLGSPTLIDEKANIP